MSTSPEYIWLDEALSTNTTLASMATDCPHGTVVATHTQTAGRGQRGNSWEAEPGKNLTFSILLRPLHIEARQQFVVSEIVSVAIVNILRLHIPREKNVAVKWPNDIYVNDSKICGILIENSLSGSNICHSIAGIGLNVNQQRFLSNAPNPVSLLNITGTETPLEPLLHDVCAEILSLMDTHTTPETQQQLHRQYCDMLWRREGLHNYIDRRVNQPIEAAIDHVAPDGMLTLRLANRELRTYAFKEVSAVL